MTLSDAGQQRRRWLLAAGPAMTGLAFFPRLLAASLPDTIDRVRPSIVAVGTYQRTRNPSFRFSGTGFVVGNGLRIATNAHVVPEQIATDKLETLAIAVPEGDSGKLSVRPATLLAMQKERDLAVLGIQGATLPPLPLGLEARVPVREGQDIACTGFPIGNALGFFPVTHRGIIASITPIGIPQGQARQLDPALIRRLADDPFRVYQLDATAYPGNSGSPVYDPDSGLVIGVINMVFVKSTKENVLSDPSGISYAIPVRYLAQMLEGLK